MKIAIVHDYLNQYGGGERVLEVLNEIFPDAPIYTSIYLKENMPLIFQNMDIRTSFMQKFPFLKKHFKKYLFFYPKAMESFDLKQYDLIISSSSAFAKGIIPHEKACHICYCYAPMRFVWDYDNYIKKEDFGNFTKRVLPLMINNLKKWDLKANKRVNYFIAISNNIKKRINDFYLRDAECIYPPVECSRFKTSNITEDYFLIVSRLNAYKNIDLVIEVFNDLNLNLKIVGTGPYKEYLMKINKSKNIQFLNRVSDNDLIEIYSKCRAFIFPGAEDFGIAPLEAQSSGRPVIAYAAGGALETIVENETGIFFKENNKDSFKEAIQKYLDKESRFKSKIIRKNALKFDKEIFKSNFKSSIIQKYQNHVSNSL